MSDSDRGSNSTIHTPIPRSAVPSPEPVDFMTLFSFLKVTRGNSVTYGIGLRDVATEPVYWAFYFFDTAADGGPGFNSEAININVANPPAVVEHRLCPLGPDDVPTFNRLVEKFRLAPGDSGAHTQGRCVYCLLQTLENELLTRWGRTDRYAASKNLCKQEFCGDAS